MEIDFEKTAKILSRCLTALVSLRSLARSGIGIQKLLAAPRAAKSEDKLTKKKDDKKEKQLHGALIHLGYKRPEVDRVVKELSGKIDSDLTDLVREAIGILNTK